MPANVFLLHPAGGMPSTWFGALLGPLSGVWQVATVSEPERSEERRRDVMVRWTVASDGAELAAMTLWDHGATAVAEADGPSSTVVLTASYPTAEAAMRVAGELGAGTEDVDPGWRDAWKAHAEPVEVGAHLLVAPAWRSVPVAGDRLVLEIDSGPCFGSGTHPSTRLILRLLAEHPPAGAVVLDVGTGSGILAVAAARLGAEEVVAVDLDPEAVAVTAANAERNGVSLLVHPSTTPVDSLDVTADVALVNVTAAVHAEVGPRVVTRVKAGGWLYVAGLLPGQWTHVAASYAGCDVMDRPELDGWVGAVLRCRADSD